MNIFTISALFPMEEFPIGSAYQYLLQKKRIKDDIRENIRQQIRERNIFEQQKKDRQTNIILAELHKQRREQVKQDKEAFEQFKETLEYEQRKKENITYMNSLLLHILPLTNKRPNPTKYQNYKYLMRQEPIYRKVVYELYIQYIPAQYRPEIHIDNNIVIPISTMTSDNMIMLIYFLRNLIRSKFRNRKITIQVDFIYITRNNDVSIISMYNDINGERLILNDNNIENVLLGLILKLDVYALNAKNIHLYAFRMFIDKLTPQEYLDIKAYSFTTEDPIFTLVQSKPMLKSNSCILSWFCSCVMDFDEYRHIITQNSVEAKEKKLLKYCYELLDFKLKLCIDYAELIPFVERINKKMGKYFCCVYIADLEKYYPTYDNELDYLKVKNFGFYKNAHIVPTNYNLLLEYHSYTKKVIKGKQTDYYKLHQKKLKPVKNVDKINKKIKSLKKCVITLDIETFTTDDRDGKGEYTGLQAPRVICIRECDTYKQFSGQFCIEESFDYLDEKYTNKKGTYYVFAHNGGCFDYIFILNTIIKRRRNVQLYGDCGNWKGIIYKNLCFYDFLRMFVCSLNDLSYTWLNKRKIDINFTHLNIHNWEQHKDEIIKYCQMDTDLLYELVCVYIDSITQLEYTDKEGNIYKYKNPFKMTISSLALDIYRTLPFYKNAMDMCGLDSLRNSPYDIWLIEKRAQHGGWTGVFGLSIKHGFKLDLNSAYGYSMTTPMPVQYSATITYSDEQPYTNKTFTNTNIYLVSFKFKDNFIHCCIPMKTKYGSITPKMTYLKEPIWGVLLNEIKPYCDYIKVYKEYCYLSAPIFSEVSNYFFTNRMKHKDNAPYKQFFKSLITNFSGKFSMKVYGEKRIGTYSELEKFVEDCNNRVMLQLLNLQDVIQKNETPIYLAQKMKPFEEMKGIGSLARFTSYITAHTRARLFQHMGIFGFLNSLYADTDSIIIATDLNWKEFSEKYKDCLDDVKLGYFKLEAEIIDGVMFAKKRYTHKERYHPPKKHHIFDPKNKLFVGSDVKCFYHYYVGTEKEIISDKIYTAFGKKINKLLIKGVGIYILEKTTYKWGGQNTYLINESHITELLNNKHTRIAPPKGQEYNPEYARFDRTKENGKIFIKPQPKEYNFYSIDKTYDEKSGYFLPKDCVDDWVIPFTAT